MIVRKILQIPAIYDLFQFIVGGKKRQKIFKNEYIGNVSGLKVLELGCGTSDILEYFEVCDYTGVDMDEYYIEFARQRYKSVQWAKFICKDINDYSEECQEKFDLVLMTGVIHHISDEEVVRCFESIKRVLKDDGRFISFDGVYRRGMTKFEEFLNDMDRGQYVRKEEEYRKLNMEHWKKVNYVCRNDMMYLPFNIIIFTNRKE